MELASEGREVARCRKACRVQLDRGYAMASRPLYPIGIVAELIGVRPETLRLWDREGLVTPKRWRRSRCYSDADLQRVLFVKHLLDEEGFNLAAVRGYVKLYYCWPLGDCVPCHETTTANGKPCWKRPGVNCGLAEQGSLLCTNCSERGSNATALPFALHGLHGASGNDLFIPAAGRRLGADKKSEMGRTDSGTRVPAKRSSGDIPGG
jgi:MerR family transcriptional regulator/heat shock protein HspR